VPDAMLATSDMGDVFYEAYRYVTTEAWGVMEEVHQPEVVAGRIKEMLREILVGRAVFTPEMRRPPSKTHNGFGGGRPRQDHGQYQFEGILCPAPR